MALLTEEKVNFSFKGWLNLIGSGNRDTAPDNFTWYEEIFSLHNIVVPSQVLLEFHEIPEAKDLLTAKSNAITYSTILQDYTGNGNAIRLTPTLNNKVFIITDTYGDYSSRLKNWVMPQLIPRTDSGFEGYPSIGYMMKLYNGDPDSGGVEIKTTDGQVGSNVGWFIHFGSGVIVCASNFDQIVDPTDVWIKGFRYIGSTLESNDDRVYKTVTIPALASTYEIDSISYSNTRSLKYLMSFIGNSTSKNMSNEFFTSKQSSSMDYSVYGKIGDDLSYRLYSDKIGSDIKIYIDNNESEELSLKFYRVKL